MPDRQRDHGGLGKAVKGDPLPRGGRFTGRRSRWIPRVAESWPRSRAAHRAVLVSEVDRRDRSSAQRWRSSREYRTLRPNFRKAGPPPETRSFARVEWPKPRYSAAALGFKSRPRGAIASLRIGSMIVSMPQSSGSIPNVHGDNLGFDSDFPSRFHGARMLGNVRKLFLGNVSINEPHSYWIAKFPELSIRNFLNALLQRWPLDIFIAKDRHRRKNLLLSIELLAADSSPLGDGPLQGVPDCLVNPIATQLVRCRPLFALRRLESRATPDNVVEFCRRGERLKTCWQSA